MSFLKPREKNYIRRPSETIYNALITDPEKRAKVLELLTQEGLVAPNENVSPNRLQQQKYRRTSDRDVANIQPSLIKQIYSPKHINKPKVRMESPSALCRRRALEALNAHSDTQNTITKPVTFDIGSLLSGIVGYCEVRSRAGDRSVGIKAMMKLMGATVLDNFTRDVTHVVFKDGTFATYQKAKLLNVHLVSVLWLEAIRRMKHRVPEAKYPARGVEDPNASIALTIQNEFDDIIADEYRESRGEEDTRDNHVTQRLKSQPRNDNIQDQDDEILQQISLLHSSTKRLSYNHKTNLSKSNSYHSPNSNTSNDDIVPCSQDARTSLSKAHHNVYKPLEIVNTHDSIHKKYTKSHETINEFSEVTRTHETFEDSSEISVRRTSRIAKHAKDSFELPKAQSIRSPESLESHRFALQEAREEIAKNSDDMLRLHITTSDESNNATKSSANSTRRMFENDLVRNSLNNQWLRKTINPGSSTHLEPVSKTKKRHTMKFDTNQDEINDCNNFLIPRTPISNNITANDSLNSTTPSNRATRYSNQLISEDDSISNDLESVVPNRRQSIPKQKSNEFIQEISTILSQSKINKHLSKPCSFLGDSNSSEEEEDIVEQRNTSKKASKTRRNSENYINIPYDSKSSAEEEEIFDQENNSNSTKRKSIVSRIDKKSTTKRSTKIQLNQQHDLDDLKTPKNKKSTTKLNSSKRVESITKNNTAQARLKTPRRKSSTAKDSSSEDDIQVIDLINSAKIIQKTPINSKSVKRDKLGLVTGRNSDKQNNKRNHRQTNNVNSEDNENLDQELIKNNKLNKSNETGSENMRIKSKNETLKSASEIDIIKPMSDVTASQSTLNLVSISETDKNRKEPKKLRRRKLYSADDSISEELFNRGATEFTAPSIIDTTRKVKHQVKMLEDFEIPKTLSKKARALLSTQKRAATTEKTKASTSTINNKKPLNFTNLKSGSSSDSATKKTKSSTRNPALATPSTRKSMRISKRMKERSTCSSDTDDTRINSTNNKRQSIGSDDSESTRNVSPRKKSCNARKLHFNSSSEIELEPSTVRRSARKLIKQVDKKSKKTPLKTISRRKIVTPKKRSPDEVIDRRSTLEFQHKSSRESLQRIRLTQKPKAVPKLSSIVCTRLHKADVEVFQEIVKQLGNFVIEDEVTERTTHLVAGGPARTINILRAVARGCWILRHEWLYKSLEAGKWLEEEEYELTEFSPVVQASRRQKQAFGPLFSMDVFKGIGEIYICRSSTPRFSDLEELVTLCGGDIVSLQRKAKICVGDFVRSETTTCVSEKWILDSITQNKKKALKNYLIIGSPIK